MQAEGRSWWSVIRAKFGLEAIELEAKNSRIGWKANNFRDAGLALWKDMFCCVKMRIYRLVDYGFGVMIGAMMASRGK